MLLGNYGKSTYGNWKFGGEAKSKTPQRKEKKKWL